MGLIMDTDKLKSTATDLSTGNKVLGGAAAVALVATFLPWYKFDVPFAETVGFSGREFTFGWMGMVLLVAAAGLVLAPAFGGKQVQTSTLRTEQIALCAAALGTLLWLVRLASLPGFNAFNAMQRSFGLYVAILAAAGVVYGVIASMKEQGIGMPKVEDFKGATLDITATAAAPTAVAPTQGAAVPPAPTAPPAPAAPQAPAVPPAPAAQPTHPPTVTEF